MIEFIEESCKKTVKNICEIFLIVQECIIEWLKKLKSLKVVICLMLLISNFVILFMLVPTAIKNPWVAVTMIGFLEVVTGGVIAWVFKIRMNEKIKINGNNFNDFNNIGQNYDSNEGVNEWKE